MRATPPEIRRPVLPGRDRQLPGIPTTHAVLGSPLQGPWPEGSQVLYVAMGCFWGAERIFWKQPGVVSTAAGYMGGVTPNPTYEETCSGRTGHAEAVQVVYDPTTLDRQGNDRGTQYRSAIYWTTEEQARAARATHDAFQGELTAHGHGEITTELLPAQEAGPFYYAEDYHQQYLHKNPFGYCNHGPNGLTCPVGLLRQDEVPAQQDILPGS